MSQRAVEAALGKLICDGAFRSEFHNDAEGAAVQAGFDLTPVELASLHRIGIEALEAFASSVDDRVQRAADPVPQAKGNRTAR